MTRLLLVRHARAVPPGDLRMPGGDPPLLPEGRAQAAAVAGRVAGLGIAALHASDAARARQTASAIAERTGLPLELRPALREMDFGAWAGRTYAEIVAGDPAAARWFDEPSRGAPPGGETILDAGQRTLAALQEIATAGRDAAVVGHAGSLRLALALALGMPPERYWRLRLDLAGLTVLAWHDGEWTVERLNDTAHLEAAGCP